MPRNIVVLEELTVAYSQLMKKVPSALWNSKFHYCVVESQLLVSPLIQQQQHTHAHAHIHTHTHKILNCDIGLAIFNMLPCCKMIALGVQQFFPAQNILWKYDKGPLQLFANVPHSIPSSTGLIYLVSILPISITLVYRLFLRIKIRIPCMSVCSLA